MTLTRPTTLATRAMIATPHHLATSAGLKMLEAGGSAMDAAIAANAVLTVVYPDQTAIGGDCFFLAFDAGTGEVTAYNGSGTAPSMANPGQLQEQGWARMPVKGAYSITVPGTIDAWFAGHGRYGKLDMAELLAPAIGLARNGFAVSPRLAGAMRALANLVYEWPALQSMVFPEGGPPRDGSILRLPALATSLEAIAGNGRDAFYRGRIANQIVQAVQDSGGWLTEDDLANHTGEWIDPLSATYRGQTILTTPPNTQGLAGLIGLKLTERTDPGPTWGNAAHLHASIEAAHRAYRVRDQHITDPRYMDVTAASQLDESNLDALWSDFDPDRSTGSNPGNQADTVYLCAVDSDGNAVSLIQSLYGAFGSCIIGGDTGILLQNRGAWFSLNPEHINVLAGGKRTMHTLMPSMIFDGDRFRGVFGTQGGDAQAQIQLQLVSNLVDFNLEPQAAIEAPRWISTPDGGILLESGFPEGTAQLLASRGHRITVIDPWNPSAGHSQMILVDPESGVLMGGADPRADGSAAGL